MITYSSDITRPGVRTERLFPRMSVVARHQERNPKHPHLRNIPALRHALRNKEHVNHLPFPEYLIVPSPLEASGNARLIKGCEYPSVNIPKAGFSGV